MLGCLIISPSYLLISVVRVVVVVVVVQDGRTLLGVHAFLILFFMVISLIQSLLHLFHPEERPFIMTTVNQFMLTTVNQFILTTVNQFIMTTVNQFIPEKNNDYVVDVRCDVMSLRLLFLTHLRINQHHHDLLVFIQVKGEKIVYLGFLHRQS